MELIFSDARVAIYDRFFESDDFHRLREFVAHESYHIQDSEAGQEIWRANDGRPFASKSRLRSHGPFHNPLDIVAERFAEVLSENALLVGSEGLDWNDIGITTYLYPRGTRISLHRDGGYGGACLAYVHSRWLSSWGGELFIPNGCPSGEKVGGGGFIAQDTDDWTMDQAVGIYIAPKPNRMVILAPTTYHVTARVDPDAGDSLRCSISAFLVKCSRAPIDSGTFRIDA